jgi:hypothetical protein
VASVIVYFLFKPKVETNIYILGGRGAGYTPIKSATDKSMITDTCTIAGSKNLEKKEKRT